MTIADTELEQLDTTDLAAWVGRPLGGTRVKEPMTVTDIRRWVQAMENPNRLYYDEEFAAGGEFGRIIAPQSFTAWWCRGQGGISATFGEIPGSHLSHVGDEWWFYGPRLYPGDHVHCDRMAYDYRATRTGFAGPSVFQRGDTTYINARGEIVAKQRTTMLRFLPVNARQIAEAAGGQATAESAEGLADREQVAEEKLEYYRSFREHVRRSAGDLTVGHELPRGVIGRHSVASFTTQWRARPDNVWGAAEDDIDLPVAYPRQTAFAHLAVDPDIAALDPGRADGLYYGPASAHVDREAARRIGMPREFGFGYAISAWALDFVTNWAGELGCVTHSSFKNQAPVLAGDATYLTGTVVTVREDPLHREAALVGVDVRLMSQTGTGVGAGSFEVRLPWTT
jgi:acyl dehydratase